MIKKTVNRLCRKYETRDPFSLADQMGILVLYEELGSIDGYYNKILRMKQIHLNQHLSEAAARFTCAHELGHAMLHPDANTPFLRTHTFFSVSRLEKEANLFAAELLIPDEIIYENCTLTSDQLARMLGYDLRLIELKLSRNFKLNERGGTL